jgi:hypothetical protein
VIAAAPRKTAAYLFEHNIHIGKRPFIELNHYQSSGEQDKASRVARVHFRWCVLKEIITSPGCAGGASLAVHTSEDATGPSRDFVAEAKRQQATSS